jgi:putative ABC transport system permease protein
MKYGKLPRRLSGAARSEAEIRAEVDEEIAFHLAMRTETLVRAGLTREAAREQAEREFGDASELRGELRRREQGAERRLRLAAWLDELRQDVRFSTRSLLRARGFTFVAVTTLSLGIGAAAAMFAVLDAVVLRPLPYAEPDRLVQVWPGQHFNQTLAAAVTADAAALESWTGLSLHDLTLTGSGEAAVLRAQAVDAGFFDVFRVHPQLGRPFRAEESDPSHSDVVLLSHGAWQARFGGDAAVLGRRIALDGYDHRTREVVGVMPRGFVAPGGFDDVDVWIPHHLRAGAQLATDSSWYVSPVIARLRDGATLEAAAAEVNGAARRVRAETGLLSEEVVQLPGAAGLLDVMVGSLRRSLWLLQGAVGLVLLLACANLANLLLARGERRRSEFAARAALGGTRTRLVRALLTEGALLALAGALGGLLVARLVLDGISVASSSGLPRISQLALDWRVAAFAVTAASTCVLLFALLPAFRVTRGDLRPALGPARRSVTASRASRRLGASLIGAEVALAMVLVTGATLLIQSFRTVRSVEAGLVTDRVLAVEIAPAAVEYDGERARIFHDRLLEEVRTLPGVRAAGAIHLLPFTWSNWRFPYLAQGHAPPAGAPLPSANFRIVTPGYFETVGVPIIAGRAFDAADDADPGIVIINRMLAEQLWPGEDAVGRELRLFGSVPLQIVGVVGDVRQHALDHSVQPEMYRPLQQWPVPAMVLMLATEGDPRAWIEPVRRLVREADPNVPVVSARPLADVLGESLAQRRFFARVLTFFGLLALTLGAVGVYGVMAYAVNARIPEFSVRLAIGATHGDVVRNALRTAAVPVLLGLVSGTLASLAAARLIESLLYGVEPHEPVAFALAAAVLGGVALFAGWLPARRVLRVQPMAALRDG